MGNRQKKNPDIFNSPEWAKNNSTWGEAYLGHLRYGTLGRNSIEFVGILLRGKIIGSQEI